MFNTVTMIGNITRDPEFRTVGNSTVAEFTIACGRRWKDKDSGDWKEKQCFMRCSAWGGWSTALEGVTKGDALMVIGVLETRKWEDKNGANRETTECRADRVMPLAKNKSDRGDSGSFSGGSQLDDEIPF